MKYSTTKTYTLKRSVIEFGKRIFKGLTRPNQKFGADMTYGMLAAKSCLLTSIVDQLHERTRKVNAVERLGRHLCEGIPEAAKNEYHRFIREWVAENPTIQIDDSDVVKPEGYKFESLGIVRDGSKSTEKKSVYEKSYHVTEAAVICPALHDGAPLECRIHIAVDGVPCLTTELAVHQMAEIVLLWRAFEKKGIARFEERAGPGLGIGQIPSRLASSQLLNLHYMRTTEEKQGRNSPAGNLNLKVPKVTKNSLSLILHVV